MEPGFAAPSAGAEDGHGLAGAFDNAILDLRKAKALAAQADGGHIPPNFLSSTLQTCRHYEGSEGGKHTHQKEGRMHTHRRTFRQRGKQILVVHHLELFMRV